MILYGIKNCDTVKKARHWLDGANLAYEFHDFRVDGLSAELLDSWCDELGWEALLNRRSTSWRALSDTDKESINEANAKRLMLATPTLIKRPVLNANQKILVGFKAAQYESQLLAN